MASDDATLSSLNAAPKTAWSTSTRKNASTAFLQRPRAWSCTPSGSFAVCVQTARHSNAAARHLAVGTVIVVVEQASRTIVTRSTRASSRHTQSTHDLCEVANSATNLKARSAVPRSPPVSRAAADRKATSTAASREPPSSNHPARCLARGSTNKSRAAWPASPAGFSTGKPSASAVSTPSSSIMVLSVQAATRAANLALASAPLSSAAARAAKNRPPSKAAPANAPNSLIDGPAVRASPGWARFASSGSNEANGASKKGNDTKSSSCQPSNCEPKSFLRKEPPVEGCCCTAGVRDASNKSPKRLGGPRAALTSARCAGESEAARQASMKRASLDVTASSRSNEALSHRRRHQATPAPPRPDRRARSTLATSSSALSVRLFSSLVSLINPCGFGSGRNSRVSMSPSGKKASPSFPAALMSDASAAARPPLSLRASYSTSNDAEASSVDLASKSRFQLGDEGSYDSRACLSTANARHARRHLSSLNLKAKI